MAGIYFIICIVIVIVALVGMAIRKSAKKEQSGANATFLEANQATPDLEIPCRVQVTCLLDPEKLGYKLRNAGYFFALNGGEKQHIDFGGSLEFLTVNAQNVLDGFGGGNGFAGGQLGQATDSLRFTATPGGSIQLVSQPTFVARAGLAGFTETTWRNNFEQQPGE